MSLDGLSVQPHNSELMTSPIEVSVRVNDTGYQRSVEPRLLLSDFLRQELSLTGTHVGCEHGVCGACTILMDGEAVRSCLIFAVQADGHELTTVEGLATRDNELHPLQAAFRDAHGLQCGFCTPGFLMTLVPFLRDNSDPTEEEIREGISGNLCRCTGYQNIVEAVRLAAERMASPEGAAAAYTDSAGEWHTHTSAGPPSPTLPRKGEGRTEEARSLSPLRGEG